MVQRCHLWIQAFKRSCMLKKPISTYYSGHTRNKVSEDQKSFYKKEETAFKDASARSVFTPVSFIGKYKL